MSDKYNRVVCGFCPDKEVCDTQREKFIGVEGSWGSLPRKCLLADSVLERHARDVVPFTVCPRCDSSEATVTVDRAWKMDLGRSATRLTYTLRCSFCSLDSSAEV